jgi:hypothetical protein
MKEEPVYFQGYLGENIGQNEHIGFDKLCEIPEEAAHHWVGQNCPNRWSQMHQLTPFWADGKFVVVGIYNESEIAIAREGDKYYQYINY